MAQDKKQSFMKGAAILSASTLIVKMLGLLFSIPLANFIDPEGMSHFYNAYNIFGLFLMLSTAGLPVAVSRMVGTAYSQGRRREGDRVFSVAFWLFFSLGLLGCLVMFFGAGQIAQWYGSPKSNYAIMALAPTLFFISIESALRGYFQGRSNMVPTATSQTIEAVTKVVIGVGLAFAIIQNVEVEPDRWAAVGAIVGVSVSAALGAIYLLGFKFFQGRHDRRQHWAEEPPLTTRQEMLVSLVRFAVPITIGSCFLSLLDTVDGAILLQRLQEGAGLSQEMADWWNGTLGHARKFFDLPGAFVVPISTSLLPVLSGAIASKDKRQVDRISSTALRATLLIGVPSSVGMAIFSRPICQLLLYNQPEVAQEAAPLLTMLSVAIAFSGLLFTTNTILQSFGRATRPVVNMAVGGVVKVVLSHRHSPGGCQRFHHQHGGELCGDGGPQPHCHSRQLAPDGQRGKDRPAPGAFRGGDGRRELRVLLGPFPAGGLPAGAGASHPAGHCGVRGVCGGVPGRQLRRCGDAAQGDNPGQAVAHEAPAVGGSPGNGPSGGDPRGTSSACGTCPAGPSRPEKTDPFPGRVHPPAYAVNHEK